MSSRHEWLQVQVHQQTWQDNEWDERREHMQKNRFTNGWTNEACEVDECNEHAPSRIDEPIKPFSMQARNNMLKFHQANQEPSKALRTLPCGGEAMIHHEDIYHQQHYSWTCTPATAWTYQHCHVKSCRVTSWVMSPTSPLQACCQSMWCNVGVQGTRLLSKEPCKLKSHGSQMVMRVVEHPQGLVSPLAINTPSFVHAMDFSPQLLPHSQEIL